MNMTMGDESPCIGELRRKQQQHLTLAGCRAPTQSANPQFGMTYQTTKTAIRLTDKLFYLLLDIACVRGMIDPYSFIDKMSMAMEGFYKILTITSG
jgi:hypothetical protein